MDFDSLQEDGAPAPVAQAKPPVSAPASFDELEDDSDKFGAPGQQAIAGLEAVGRGIAGPLAPLAERALGVKPEDIRAREEANPVTSGLGEAAGFAGSMIAGTGMGKLISGVGEGAAKLAGLGAESTISRIASHGITTGAEMAALQASNEVSKAITEDPNASLGQAAINIGLSGIMGGVGGAAIGSISPLWKSTMEKVGAPKILDDAKAQYQFRKGLPGGDAAAAVTGELTTRMAEVDTLAEQMGSLKGASLARAMPEVSEANSSKINAQIEEIGSMLTKDIEKASGNAYLKGAVPKLKQDFQEFLQVATDPAASYADKFDAIDTLKRAQQAKARYNLTAEDTALGQFTKNTARDLRLKLEDPKVWGDAGHVQREVNAAIKASIDAEKDAASKFTSKLLGERVADPNKVQTLINQTLKGKAGLKTDILKNYLEHTEKLADTVNKIHVEAGLEAPIRLTPAPSTNFSLGRSSPGTTLGNWLYDKGLASVAGHLGAEGVGAGLGSLIGHPALGALAGERILAPTFTALAKPLLENASRAEAFKGAMDYVGMVARGERLLNKASESIFKSGGQIIPTHLIPDMASRDKLERSIEHNQVPDNALQIAGNLDHYLPDHKSAAAATSAGAMNYLKALKPTQMQRSPLDKPSPIDRNKQNQYHRALDIAQQPLMILQHVKDGSLRLQDVQTMKAIYPNLYSKMVSKVSQDMMKAMSEGKPIPYHQRLSITTLTGQPMDSTMVQPTVQAIMASNAPRAPQQGGMGQGRAPKATSKSMERVNSMYATPQQSRAAHRLGK